MLVNVTEDDIKYGCKSAPGLCPVALAIKRTFGINEGVSVIPSDVAIFNENLIIQRATFPHHVRDFILDFDHGRVVQPISFDMELEEV